MFIVIQWKRNIWEPYKTYKMNKPQQIEGKPTIFWLHAHKQRFSNHAVEIAFASCGLDACFDNNAASTEFEMQSFPYKSIDAHVVNWAPYSNPKLIRC